MAEKVAAAPPDRRVVREGEEECFERHERWMEVHLDPKIRMIVLTMVGACVTVGAAIFFYISNNTVRDHELKEATMYVRQESHEKDIARIEDRITSLERNIARSMDSMSAKLDRNLEEIRRR